MTPTPGPGRRGSSAPIASSLPTCHVGLRGGTYAIIASGKRRTTPAAEHRTHTGVLDRLCGYLGCQTSDLVEHFAD